MSCAGYTAGHLVAAQWAKRCWVNGASSRPSRATQDAAATFYNSIAAGGILSKMKAVNIIAPDSLIAARTPFLRKYGSDPWTEIGGSGTLTAAGWAGTAAIALDTGVNFQTAFANDTNHGWSIYVGQAVVPLQNTIDCGVWADDAQYATRYDTDSAWSLDSGVSADGVNLGVGGYMSANRVANNDLRVFWGNSTNAHQQTAFTNAVNATTRSAVTFILNGAKQTAGTIFIGGVRIESFLAIHEGLSLAESLILFNAVQALRTTLGGAV